MFINDESDMVDFYNQSQEPTVPLRDSDDRYLVNQQSMAFTEIQCGER